MQRKCLPWVCKGHDDHFLLENIFKIRISYDKYYANCFEGWIINAYFFDNIYLRYTIHNNILSLIDVIKGYFAIILQVELDKNIIILINILRNINLRYTFHDMLFNR